MPDDLKKLFGEVASQVPTAPEEEFDFTEDILPIPPMDLVTDRLVISKVRHRYGGTYEVDLLWFYANYDTYRHLALLILASMFHSHDSPIRLDLTHPSSDIKHIFIDYNYKESAWRQLYYSRPYRLHYYAPPNEKYPTPAAFNPILVEDRIRFKLANYDDNVPFEEEFEKRETVWIEGSERACAWFVEYLLNVGRPEGGCAMYGLEGSGEEGTYLGFQSAEVSFRLPDSGYWPEDLGTTEEESAQEESDISTKFK